MADFAVIEVESYYEEIEQCTCLDVFETLEEAEHLVKDIKDKSNSQWKNKLEYIDQFVENMVVPETDYKGWLKFLERFYPFGASYVRPPDFKRAFKSYLKNYNPKLEGFNPPAVDNPNPQLFVVEIKKRK